MTIREVTVISATFNAGSVLSACLNSVSVQEDIDLEHIVVDGGSSDESIEVLRGFKNSRLTWISEPDNGIADAMNKGARLAKGNWLFFLQADDRLLDSRSLISALEYLDNRDHGLLACGIRSGGRFLLPAREGKVEEGWPFMSPFKQPFRHQGLLISRRAWERVGPYRADYRVTMDFDWMLRAYWSGVSVARAGLVLADVGTGGISSALKGTQYRIRLGEEQKARLENAPTRAWKLAYRLIWPVYLPYRLTRTRLASL